MAASRPPERIIPASAPLIVDGEIRRYIEAALAQVGAEAPAMYRPKLVVLTGGVHLARQRELAVLGPIQAQPAVILLKSPSRDQLIDENSALRAF